VPYKPEVYSYERAALARGYSVLSFDRLGAGKSEKPDPFNIVQIPLDIQLAVSISRAVRHGKLAPARLRLPRFHKVVYVGHSLGSAVLNAVLVEAPTLLDAAVLTGVCYLTCCLCRHSTNLDRLLRSYHRSQYTHPLPPIINPTVAAGQLQIARDTFPQRFGHLSEGYVVVANRSVFYGPPGSYENKALALDTATQNIVSVGEQWTLQYGVLTAPNFRGHVLTVVGQQDMQFCRDPGCTNVFDEAGFFPAARSFEGRK
jgi:pimeloyl-ACP methyl ester carboxylesterase